MAAADASIESRRPELPTSGGRPPPGIGPYKLARRRLRRNKAALAFGALFLLIVRRCACWRRCTPSTIAHTGAQREPRHRHDHGRRQEEGRRLAGRHPDRPDVAEAVLPRRRPERPRHRGAAALRRAQLARRRLRRARSSRCSSRRSSAVAAGYFRGATDARPQQGVRRHMGLSGGAARHRARHVAGAGRHSASAVRAEGQLADGARGRSSASSTSRTWPSRCAARCSACASASSSTPRALQGFGDARIMVGEILPNLASTMIVFIPLIIANAILLEAGPVLPRRRRAAAEPVVGDDDLRRHPR